MPNHIDNPRVTPPELSAGTRQFEDHRKDLLEHLRHTDNLVFGWHCDTATGVTLDQLWRFDDLADAVMNARYESPVHHTHTQTQTEQGHDHA